MARIQTYTTDTAVASNDKFIGTDGAVGANNATKNFTVGDLTGYLITGDTNYIQLVNSSGVLANSVIYQDTDGHVGIGVTGTNPNPAHRFEVFDLRDENAPADYSSVITTHINDPFNQGTGGFLTRVSTNNGATYPGQIGIIPGTGANDLVSNIKLAFFANSDMSTVDPSNLAGTVTHDDTNAHWILNGTIAETTTHTLKVNGTSEFTGAINASGVYLGGTNADNLLDDYEKGTYIPSITATGTDTTVFATIGYYTKIGDIVHVQIRISKSVDEGETSSITNVTLPFTANDTSTVYYKGGLWHNRTSDLSNLFTLLRENTIDLTPYNGSSVNLSLAADESNIIGINITYKTS